MYTAQFSEFSYGYTLTDNIMHSGLPATPIAPVFPSLIAEGSSGGGYDVQIPLYPVPIFLQFKIPQVVRRRSTKMPTGFTKPYLRMHLRTKRPNQHQLLLDLETSGKVVAYAAPDFWQTSELDRYFNDQVVHLKTRYFTPSQIGALDDKAHEIAYCTSNPEAWLFSEPRKLDGHCDGEAFGKQISLAVKRARRQSPLDFLGQISALITALTASRRPTELLVDNTTSGQQRQNLAGDTDLSDIARAVREAAYLTRVRLGCTLIIT